MFRCLHLPSSHSCAVTYATNGQEAVDIFARSSHPFDMIFMDIHMPVVDGVEATRQILDMTSSKDAPPIIALTADILDQERLLSQGFTSVLSKPYSITQIQQILLQHGRRHNQA